MPYPAGVKTATLTFSNVGTFLGREASKTIMEIDATASVVWAATGEPIDNFAEIVDPGEGMPGSLTAPFVDQDGFTDQAGNAFKMWTYRLTRRARFGGESKTVTKVWQPLLGQEVIDFDNLPGGVAGLPVAVPIPPVTSVAGETGAVGAEALAGQLVEFLPGAEITPEAVEANLPERLSEGALSDTIDTQVSAAVDALPAWFSEARAKLVYPGNRAGFIGDSITWGFPGPANVYSYYAALKSNKRILHVVNAGVSANTTGAMLARLQADVIAKDVDFCLVLGGINDIKTGVPAATTQANLTGIYEMLEAAGVRPVPMTVLAWTAGNTAQRASIVALNDWIKTYAGNHFLDVIDLYPDSLDSVTGGMKTSWSTEAEGLHPDLAYQTMGALVAERLAPRLPAVDTQPALAATEPRNLMTNALLEADTNADGIPDGWTANFGTNYTHTLESKVDVLGKWATLTMGAGAENREMVYSTWNKLAAGLAFADPGDRVAYLCKVDLQPTSSAGCQLHLRHKATTIHNALNGIRHPVKGIVYGEAVLPSDYTGHLELRFVTGAGAGVYRLGQPAIINLTKLGLT